MAQFPRKQREVAVICTNGFDSYGETCIKMSKKHAA